MGSHRSRRGDTNYYGYGGVGNLTSYQNAGGTWTYDYYANNQLQDIYEPGQTTPISWAKFDPTTSTTEVQDDPNGVEIRTTLDGAGRPHHILAKHGTTILQDLSYVYDVSGIQQEQVHTMTDNQTGNVTTYTYGGPLEQLTEAKTVNGSTTVHDYTYIYDGAGNLTSINGASHSYNADNQDTGSGNTYDLDGNQTAVAGDPSMTYVDRSHTHSITSGSTTNYLGVFSPLMDELTSDGSLVYHYNLMGLGWRYDIGSATAAFYTRTPAGQVVGEHIGSTYRYPLEDKSGTITAQTDSSGTVSRSYTYDPNGNLTASSGTPWDDTIGYDQGINQTGGLVHFGARLYDPATGRWTTEEPLIGRLSSTYTYSDGDPINYMDPDGDRRVRDCLLALVICIRIGGGVAPPNPVTGEVNDIIDCIVHICTDDEEKPKPPEGDPEDEGDKHHQVPAKHRHHPKLVA